MALPVMLLLGGCPSDPGSLVCEDVMGDGSRAETDCGAVVAAVVGELADGDEVTEAAVWAFVGCPPGAYCGLMDDPQPSPLPVSALIGVRTGDGDASMWVVTDVAAHPLEPSVTLGYDPNDFIDGLGRSAAASRAP